MLNKPQSPSQTVQHCRRVTNLTYTDHLKVAAPGSFVKLADWQIRPRTFGLSSKLIRCVYYYICGEREAGSINKTLRASNACRNYTRTILPVAYHSG